MAVVFVFDRDGGFVASGRAPLEFGAIAAGDESPFPGDDPGREGRRPLPRQLPDRRPASCPTSIGARHSRCPIEGGHANPPLLATLALSLSSRSSLTAQSSDGFRFRSGVELVNVTATVTDDNGRFVSGLRKDDFTVYDDGARQEVTYFSNERVPVSLGILLDASGSMTQRQDGGRARRDRPVHLRPARQGRRAVLHGVCQRTRGSRSSGRTTAARSAAPSHG